MLCYFNVNVILCPKPQTKQTELPHLNEDFQTKSKGLLVPFAPVCIVSILYRSALPDAMLQHYSYLTCWFKMWDIVCKVVLYLHVILYTYI